MIAGLFNAYSLLEIGTYKPSSVDRHEFALTCMDIIVKMQWRAKRHEPAECYCEDMPQRLCCIISDNRRFQRLGSGAGAMD